MKSLARQVLKLLSEKQRHGLYRRLTRIPAEALNPQITVEIAATEVDLKKAYSLLHDCYVEMKLINAQPSGLRCSLFSFLPTTTTVVAKLHGEVIGTMSLIKDSKCGLPSDKEFHTQNDSFRQREKILVEASALAVAPTFRGGSHHVSLLLMKYLYNYCKTGFAADYIVAAVHPKSNDFYRALFQFRRNSDVVEYNALHGAAAVHMTMDLSESHVTRVVNAYGTHDLTRNVMLFIIAEDARFKYPHRKAGRNCNPVVTPELLKYFCIEQKEVWERFDLEDKRSLIQIFRTLFNPEDLTPLSRNLFLGDKSKAYRSPIQITSLVQIANQNEFRDIEDLSAGGCFVKWSGELPQVNEKLEITFKLDNKSFRLPAEIAWQKQNPNQTQGVGIRFTKPAPTLNQQIQRWLYEWKLTQTGCLVQKRS